MPHIPFGKIRIITLCLTIIILLSTSPQAHGQASYSKETLARIQKVEQGLAGWLQIGDEPTHWTLAERMKYYHVNGISIAVIKNYHLEWAKGYGWADSAEGRPVTTHTLFQAGSISKSLNAVGVLKLVQEGKLDLYADINQYLKSWKFPYDSLSKGKKSAWPIS